VRYGVGVDNIDLSAASERGIIVSNVPDYGIEEVANHTLALLLLFARRLDLWAQALESGQWGTALPKIALPRLSQTTLGIVGLGRIGRAVLSRAHAFWGRVLVFDPWVSETQVQALGGIKTSLEELLSQSDFVTLHVPSTAETKQLLTAERIGRMKRGAVLVNCSRGDVIDEAALAQRISEGHLSGAGLDVFATEPPPLDGIVSHPHVWATPHVAFVSIEAVRDLRRKAAEEAGRVLLGQPPQYAVTPLVPGNAR
jgi:D-3-phosphoglycerate dehydrogenase